MKVKMIHIPKCAGVTIKTILSQYPNFYECIDHTYGVNNDLKGFFSFIIVRNPWDRLWSGYNFLKNGSDYKGPKPNTLVNKAFPDFIKHIYDNKLYNASISKRTGSDLIYHKQSNWILDDDGNQLVDYIARFENLDALFQLMETDMGMVGCKELFKSTHLNKSKKSNPYTEAYDKESIELVREMYANDIELFNYTFNENNRSI